MDFPAPFGPSSPRTRRGRPECDTRETLVAVQMTRDVFDGQLVEFSLRRRSRGDVLTASLRTAAHIVEFTVRSVRARRPAAGAGTSMASPAVSPAGGGALPSVASSPSSAFAARDQTAARFAGWRAVAEREPRADADDRHRDRGQRNAASLVVRWKIVSCMVSVPPAGSAGPLASRNGVPVSERISPTVENCGDDIDTDPTFSIADRQLLEGSRPCLLYGEMGHGRGGAETLPAPTCRPTRMDR